MTDPTTALNEDLAEEDDPRIQLAEVIAEGLAILSEASDTPAGVEAASSTFTSSDVDFTSDNWMSRLADVQGWLNFGEELPNTSAPKFCQVLISALGLDPDDEMSSEFGVPGVSDRVLVHLAERIEIAIRLQADFLDELGSNGASLSTASQAWTDAWGEIEDSDQPTSPEPVTAKADVWPIFLLTKRPPNLTPSYQRGDVWRNVDRQSLIESILRGVPLPSIILLRTGASSPHEVVDGKQRLTAILRFVGQHPIALQKVAEADSRHEGKGLKDLFHSDYPKFRRAWKALEGQPLTARVEDSYYFPFKLRGNGDGGLIGEYLEPLQGKYYTQIKKNLIRVSSQELEVETLFEGAADYKIPVIEYIQATQRQIHDVFRLYNKQGVHLNAEEIRNAVYHEVELTRATLIAAGDADPSISGANVAQSLDGIPNLDRLGQTLSGYGFGDSRYKRTKVLSWVISVLVHDTGSKPLTSTARNIDQLLESIQRQDAHPLAQSATLKDLFSLLVEAVELHASHDELWSESFMDGGKGVKWQELQLVGSIVGIAMALAASPNDLEDRIETHSEGIRTASATQWKRPEKTQTRTQWDYIARVSKETVELLDLDPTQSAQAIKDRFGSSGYESIQRMIIKPGS